MVIVHYFGQPQPVAASVRFCEEHSLLLIEDNAHGFGSSIHGRALGTLGDIGISAPRKCFPIRHGAYLHIPVDRTVDITGLSRQPVRASRRKTTVKRWLRRMPGMNGILQYRRRAGEQRRHRAAMEEYASQGAFRDPPPAADYGMDEDVDAYIERQDMARVKAARQRIYSLWESWALTEGLAPVFPGLAAGASPLVFAAFTGSAEESRSLFERGRRASIDIHSWPTLPYCIVEQNSSAMRLWERLVCFPIHQDMDIEILTHRLELL
jgi:hypothetical protein